MSRFLSTLLLPLALFFVAPDASAQLLQVEFTDEKDLKKYEKYMTIINGQPRLICESADGIIVPKEGQVSVQVGTKVEVWIGDPSDPSVVPYKMKKGELVPTNKKWLLSIKWDGNKRSRFFDQNQTFAGLAKEYGIRTSLIEDIEEERNSHPKGSAEWFRNHLRLVGANKRLQSWLANTGYGKASAKLGKTIKKLEKVITKEAVEYRLKAALDSIEMVETPEELVEAAETVKPGGGIKFKVQESAHVRIVYVDELEDGLIRSLLTLAETTIDGFKQEFVDPYLDVVDYRDKIPDRIIHEFFFSPADFERGYEEFLVEYYGLGWGKDKERRIKLAGNGFRLGRPARQLSYTMLREQNDLEGRVAHSIGHTLAHYHYRQGGDSAQMAWLDEAVGYYMSFEMLGRNSLTCFQWIDEEAQRYRKPKVDNLKEGEKEAVLGMRDAFNAMALESGPKIDALALKTLFELNNADFAKGWSFFDYIARKTGKKGQLWLRAGCKASVTKKTMINDWRTASEELYETSGVDIFKKLDDEWKVFAESEQDTTGG